MYQHDEEIVDLYHKLSDFEEKTKILLSTCICNMCVVIIVILKYSILWNLINFYEITGVNVMIETIRFKNVVKLFLLVIAVGLVATVIPATFADRIDEHGSYEEAVHELKHDLVEQVGGVWELNELDFTVDSWSNLHAVAVNAEEILTEIAQRLVDLEAMYLEIAELEEELEEVLELEYEEAEEIELFSHEIPDLEELYQEILEELQEIESALEEAYNSLERIDETSEADVLTEDESTETAEIEEETDEEAEYEEYEYEEYIGYEVELLELLTMTRREFESMTSDEIIEMAEEGGYMPIGVTPNIMPLSRNAEPINCPNMDGIHFVNNVIVDGVVCIGTPFEESSSLIEPFSSVDVSDGAAFLSAWNDPTTTVINLTNHIVLTGSGVARTNSIRIEGNGRHLTMTSRGTTAGNTVSAGLTLGAASPGSMLEFNDVRMGRVITNAGGSGANAASLTGVVAGAAQPVSLFTSTALNSQNWTVRFHDNVISSTTSATAIANSAGFVFNNVFGTGNAAAATANPQNRSGILNMPNSVVRVEGTGNSFAAHSTHSTGLTVFNVREFIACSMPTITITGAGGGQAFPTHHTTINLTCRESCDIVPSGETRTVTTSGNVPAVDAECLIVEEDATLEINAGSLTTAHAIQVVSFVLAEENATITINRGGTGNGIHAPNGSVIFGPRTNVDITRTAGGGATATLINTNHLTIDRDAVVNLISTGAGHGLWIQNLELRAGTQSVDHESDVLPWEQAITTTTLNVVSVGTTAGATVECTLEPSVPAGCATTGTAVRVRNNGEINIRENARVRIHTGTNGGTNTVAETSAGNHTLSNGLHGYISVFNMEGNSFMDIESSGVGFRSRISTTYTMIDGARKNIYARIGTGAAGGGNNAAGRTAFALANTYITGTSATTGAVPNRENHTHSITLTGEGTILSVEGYPGNLHATGTAPPADGRPNRSNMMIYGDNSTINISDGAQLNNISHRTTALTVFGEGTNFNVNTGGLMNIIVHGSGNDDSGAFRFLQTGGQTFNLSGGDVHITATGGNAGLLRAFGGNNAFYVNNGGRFVLRHLNDAAIAPADAEAGRVPRGMDFASGNSTEATADRFVVSGYRSEVYINIANGIGVDGDSGSSITRVEVSDEAILEISAESRMPSGSPSAGQVTSVTNHGVFNAGVLILRLNNPMFFDFVQRGEVGRMGEALLFNTGAASRIEGTNTDLAVWRNNRTGNTALVDPISNPARGFWTQMDFTVAPNVANFASTAIASTNEPNFTAWFTSTANMPGTGTANAGWRQIRRINANNARPTVDILRPPTDADQRIFGHVSLEEGNRSARSTGTNEVFVDLIINNTEGDFVQRINNVPTGNRTVFDVQTDDGVFEHYGIFEAEIDFSIGFETGTTFLPAGYTVEVVRARRSSVLSPNTTVTTTDPDNGVPLIATEYRFRETNAIDHAHLILTEREVVRDVTPPLQVDDVTGLVSGSLRFGGAVTPATTSITGTGEPGAIVRVGRVTPATAGAAVTGVEWFSGTATVDSDGDWEFTIPSGVTLAVGNRLSIYISDGETLDGDYNLRELIPNPVAPNVIFRPELATPETLERLSHRWRVADITLPRTTRTDLWPAAFGSLGEVGNINYHWNQRTSFHDAIGTDAFDYAYILTVEETLDSDFEFIKTRPSGSPLSGVQFRLYARTTDGLAWESTPIATVTSGGDGVVGFDGLTHGGQYRLREHAAAPGFVAPPTNHYWVITVSDDGVIGDPVPGNADTPTFDGTLEDDDLTLENQHRIRDYFEFVKESNLTNLPLPGAEFRLYRRAENGTDWDFITDDLESVAVTGVVRLENLRFGGEYRLIETLAPTNYSLPPTGHHWIINVNITDGSITLPTHHGEAPAFINRGGDFFLPNIRSTVELFEFIKTEDDGETPLPEAEFNLYRWDTIEDEWVLVRSDLESAAVTGAVRIENFLTYGSQYRLVETVAPERFVTPPDGHYWLITVDSTGNIVTPTHHEGAPAFDDEDGLFLPNDREGVPFSFTKTNDYLYLGLDHANFRRLDGARFVLSRYAGDGEWEYIETVYSSSDSADLGLVEFNHYLTMDGVYRLDETQAPTGYRLPQGQWIITWNEATERFVINAEGVLSLVPAFRGVYRSVETGVIIDNPEAYDGEVELYLYVGNFPEVRLPGTGGLGAMSMTIIGGLALMFVVLVYVRGKLVDDVDNSENQVA